MYDFPVARRATDAWWRGLAAHCRRAGVDGVPDHLSRPGEGLRFWLAPDLLFSQCCGFPLVTALAGRVALLGTPGYDLDGCDGADYCSFVVVRADFPADGMSALRGRRCAINLAESWSGHHALRLLAGDLIEEGRPAFGVVSSGSHAASIDAVHSGRADFAAIDCVSFALLGRVAAHRTAGLRVLAQTPRMPGLPLIAGGRVSASDIRRLKEALQAAFEDPALSEERASLGLKTISFTEPAEYARLSSALRRLDEQGIPPLIRSGVAASFSLPSG